MGESVGNEVGRLVGTSGSFPLVLLGKKGSHMTEVEILTYAEI